MGYPYSAYAVDLQKLAAAAKSKDPTLAETIAKKFAKDISDNTNSFEEEIEEGAPTVDVALAEIIAGKTPKKTEHGFQYGYALELLTKHVGTRIDEDEIGLGAGDAIEKQLKKAEHPEFDELMKTSVLPIPIPEPDDFPMIGTLDGEAIEELVSALDAIEATMAKMDPARNVSGALRSWCAKATKKKCGLVWFAY